MNMMGAAPRVSGLDVYSQNRLDELWMQWVRKLPRNTERLMYLDGRNKLKDLRVAIPPQLKDSLDVVMGWAEKAVSEPANRTVFEGMVGADGLPDPLAVSGMLYENRFDVEFPQAVRAALTYSCAFVSTMPGDVASGQPSVVLSFHSAMWATGLWDRARRALSAGLLVNDVDALGYPKRFTLLLADETLVCEKLPGGWHVTWRSRNRLGRVGLELMPWIPELDRPFGRSRIDRRVMSLVDRAVRAGARLDVHSELFSAMKLILLGVEDEVFKDESGRTVPLWDWYMGRFNTLSSDENGDVPKLEQIRAESPEPHIATMRQLASEFSGHTGVPLGALGIAQDNPESADAKNVAREDIVFAVEQEQRVLNHVLSRSFANMVAIRDGVERSADELAKIEFLWRRPDRASTAALADAGLKQVDAAGLRGTRVGMRMIGMTQAQIAQADEELRRMSAGKLLDRLETMQTAGVGASDGDGSESAVR